MAESQGFDAELLVEPGQSAHTFDVNSERYVIDSESIRKTQEHIDCTGIRGTRSKQYGRIVTGNYGVGGDIVMRPGQSELNLWIPRILYGTEVTDDFPLAEAIPAASYFGVLIDKVGDIHQYNDCVVNTATFRSSAGDALELTLGILGKTETLPSWPASPPAVYSSTATNRPILFSQGTLTLNSEAMDFESFELVIDNHITPAFRNSATAQYFTPADRTITLRVQIDYNSTTAGLLYGFTPVGIDGDLEFIPGVGKALTFTFAKLMSPDITPIVGGKGPIMWDITLLACETSTTKELVITNDLTA